MFEPPKLVAQKIVSLWGEKYLIQKKEVNGKGGRRVIRLFICKKK